MLSLCLIACFAPAAEPAWPQFRGPEASGVAAGKDAYPADFGPTRNVAWKTPLPSGVSSPVVWGHRLFVTGFDAKARKLETLCLDRRDGKVLWRRAAPAEQFEKVHATSSVAAASPATDGRRVVVFFGSYGALCYDLAGKELWKRPIATPATMFGTGASPVIAGGRVLLKLQGQKSSLLALDVKTGESAWQKPLPFLAGYSLPLAWENHGTAEVVVAGEGGVRAYVLGDGAERWSLNLGRSQAIASPVRSGESRLLLLSYFSGGDQDDRMQLPDFADLLKKHDADKDGLLSKEEVKDLVLYSRGPGIPNGDIKLGTFFDMVDLNRDGKVSRFEWAAAKLLLAQFGNSLVSVSFGKETGKARPKVEWKEQRSLPEVATPLCYRGRVYYAKHNGIVTCLEEKTGKLLFRKRTGAEGLIYASPVAADGKVYLCSRRGRVVVLAAADELKVLARNDLGEEIAATPALVGGVIYLRTASAIYAIRQAP